MKECCYIGVMLSTKKKMIAAIIFLSAVETVTSYFCVAARSKSAARIKRTAVILYFPEHFRFIRNECIVISGESISRKKAGFHVLLCFMYRSLTLDRLDNAETFYRNIVPAACNPRIKQKSRSTTKLFSKNYIGGMKLSLIVHLILLSFLYLIAISDSLLLGWLDSGLNLQRDDESTRDDTKRLNSLLANSIYQAISLQTINRN